MRFSKWQMVLGIVAVISVAATSAYATDVFDDVDDGRFFSEPAEWAANLGITQGCGGGNFCPNDPVTRGENITFAKRYDDFVVQPALSNLDDTIEELEDQLAALQAEIDAAESEIAGNVNDIANLPDVYFAEVAANGALERNTFGVAVSNTATGFYEVQFPVSDVASCVWQATIAQKTSTGLEIIDTEVGVIALRTDFDGIFPFTRDADSILVVTRDADGNLANRPFHLTITCGLPTLIFVPPIDPGIIITLDE